MVEKWNSRNKPKWGKFHTIWRCLYLVFMPREWYPLSHILSWYNIFHEAWAFRQRNRALSIGAVRDELFFYYSYTTRFNFILLNCWLFDAYELEYWPISICIRAAFDSLVILFNQICWVCVCVCETKDKDSELLS